MVETKPSYSKWKEEELRTMESEQACLTGNNNGNLKMFYPFKNVTTLT